MAQYGRPRADVAVNGWTYSTGATLFGCIDEVTPSDTDYIDGNLLAYCEVSLTDTLGDPRTGSGHILRYRYGRNPTNRTVTLVIRLMQGATEIASWTHVDPALSFNLAEQTLTSEQANAITDYTDLRVRCDITAIQNSQAHAQVSWIELEIPDASSSSPSASPSGSPSSSPSASVSKSPSSSVSASPSSSASKSPSSSASHSPSASASHSPSASVSASPSASASASPSASASHSPSASASHSPSASPSASPSHSPSGSPSGSPSASPSASSSHSPSASPSGSPSDSPSSSPSASPYPASNPLAFGEENPTNGETPISWATWSDGAGGAPTITGDADWGKLALYDGDQGRSAVYDLGSSTNRHFTLTENRYGAGGGSATLQIRGSTISFSQDDVLPNWENYIAPITRNWRYVQVRETTDPFLGIATGSRQLAVGNDLFYLHGDTPWSLISQLPTEEAYTYLLDAYNKGFNSIIVFLIDHLFCDNAPNDYYDVPPFTGSNFTTPNATYFDRADLIIQRASQYGIIVFLYPLSLGYYGTEEGWDTEVAAASQADMESWGAYLGNRYKDFPNIVWVVGCDQDPVAHGIDDKVEAFANALKTADPNHLLTAHNIRGQLSTSPSWADGSWISLNAAYPTHNYMSSVVGSGYSYSPTTPVFMIEGWYEGSGGDPNIGAQECRAQAYWSILAGGCGHFYGNNCIWPFDTIGYCQGYEDHLEDGGRVSMQYVKDLFDSIAWNTLIPDAAHDLITSGYGTIDTADYAGAAIDSGGTLAVIYMPSNRTMTIDCTQMAGTFTARWYDPTDGSYAADGASPLANTGTHEFSHAGTNDAGDADWVLVLEA